MVYTCRYCKGVLAPKSVRTTVMECPSCEALNIIDTDYSAEQPPVFCKQDTMSPFRIGTAVTFEMSTYQLNGRLILFCDGSYRNLWSLTGEDGTYKILMEYLGNYFFLSDWISMPATHLANIAVNSSRKLREIELRIMCIDHVREIAVEGELQFKWPVVKKGLAVIEAGDHQGNAGLLVGGLKDGLSYAEGKMCGYDDFAAVSTRVEGVWVR